MIASTTFLLAGVGLWLLGSLLLFWDYARLKRDAAQNPGDYPAEATPAPDTGWINIVFLLALIVNIMIGLFGTMWLVGYFPIALFALPGDVVCPDADMAYAVMIPGLALSVAVTICGYRVLALTVTRGPAAERFMGPLRPMMFAAFLTWLIAMPIVLAAVDCYTRVNAEGVNVNYLLSPRETHYRWKEVPRARLFATLDPSGRSGYAFHPHLELELRDGTRVDLWGRHGVGTASTTEILRAIDMLRAANVQIEWTLPTFESSEDFSRVLQRVQALTPGPER